MNLTQKETDFIAGIKKWHEGLKRLNLMKFLKTVRTMSPLSAWI
ncbi:MAG: hypothetical protein ACFNUJ_01120 [Campylobacter curvus]